jgi:hypothetical protein
MKNSKDKKYLILKKKKRDKKGTVRFADEDDVPQKLKKSAILDFIPTETTYLAFDDIVFTRKDAYHRGMDYVTSDNTKYNFSYQEIKNDYHKFKDMTDQEFIDNALDILHFCCFVSYLKELPAHAVLVDDGIIHELVHIISDDTRETAISKIDEIRKTFNSIMEIA